MSRWGKFTLTNKGAALLSKVQTRGVALSFTNIKIGSGQHSETMDLKELESLAAEKQTIGISSKNVIDSTTCKLVAIITNIGLAAGYYIREIGLYANDPDEGEILYMINYDSVPDYLPAESEGSVVEQDFSIFAKVNDAETVVISVDYNTLAKKANTLSGYGIEDAYTKTASDTLLAIKADKSDTYTKTETNNLLSNKANVSDLDLKADKSNTYTKSEVDTSLTNYLPLSGGSMTGVLNCVTPADNDNSAKVATTKWVSDKLTKELNSLTSLACNGSVLNTKLTFNNGTELWVE